MLHTGIAWVVSSTIAAVEMRRAQIHEVHLARTVELPIPIAQLRPIFAPAQKSRAVRDEPARGRPIQLPVEVPVRKVQQALVQLYVPPDVQVKSQAAVPAMMLWQLPAPPKPKQQVVAAHAEEPPPRPPELAPADPHLSARNREPNIADLAHSTLPTVAAPSLPVPLATTTPVRNLNAAKGFVMPSSTGAVTKQPEEVHVVSVPDVNVPYARVVNLPPVNQAPPPGVPTGNGVGSKGTAETGSTAKDASGIAAGGSTAKDATGTASTGSKSKDSNGSALASTPPPALPLPAGAIRTLRPKDGKFTVVVTGTSNVGSYPEVAGLLSGRLVYSVYVRTGGRKEWILQYCLPRNPDAGGKSQGGNAPLEAPYPFVIYRPKLDFLNDNDYVIVHGFITPLGRFDQLSTVGEVDSSVRSALLAALANWEFRPASRDGEPSAVEVALIIPREPI